MDVIATLGVVLLWLLLAALALGFYFLPSFIGWNKRSSGAIIALNMLLGWTAIGWIVALIWALTADQPATVVIQTNGHQLLSTTGTPALCSACGKYSPSTSRFCQECGRSIASE
jgi:nitric oxide reductase large subunit